MGWKSMEIPRECKDQKIRNKGLSALSQAQAVKFRLMQGLSVRRAAYSVVKFIMDKGAKGCEVVVTGKLRGQRAKAMKFRDGLMIHAGDITNYYVEKAVKHVHLRQGVIGIKVKIMLPHDPTGQEGIVKDLPDAVKIEDPEKADPLAPMINMRQPTGLMQPEYVSNNAPITDVRTLEDPAMGGMGGGGMPSEQMQQAPPPDDGMQAMGGMGGGGGGGDVYQPPMQQQAMQPPQQQYGQPPPQGGGYGQPQGGGYGQY